MEEAIPSRWNRDENLLAEVFNQCDRDGSGYITRDELAALCRGYERQDEGGLSPGRLDALMATLDVDNDGHISFEEFKAGFQSYSASHLAPDDSFERAAVKSSTPKHMLANEEVYESAVESEFSWNEAADRVDPDGLLEGMGVEKVWSELAAQEPNMLEPFENFLCEVVLQMQHNKQDKYKLQNHIKKIMAQHSREVSEMEQILEEQVLRAQEDSQKKNTSKTKQLSSHYSSLLAEREAQIERLEAKETSLQRTLDDKVSNETHLKQERRRLINANEELRQQLTSPPTRRPSSSNLDDQLVQQWVEPVSEDKVKFYPPVKSRDHVSESEESLPRSIVEEEVLENSNLVERPRPLGEDGCLIAPIATELPPQPQASPSVVNRVFKVAFLGDSGVGKTSLILRLCEGRFNASCVSTLGLDFSTKMLTVGEERVVFQLWDTAGQERFRNALTPVYFRRADAFVIVYDVTNWKSFKSSKSWLSIVSAALREQPPVVMLVGNKTDRQEKREVTLDDGRHLALELHALFSEMSALSGDNVLQAHTTLAQLLLKRENEHLETVKNKVLEITSENKRKCSC